MARAYFMGGALVFRYPPETKRRVADLRRRYGSWQGMREAGVIKEVR